MYALVFLICISGSDCAVQSYDYPFINVDHCHTVAQDLINLNLQRQSEGAVPPHTAQYSCVLFGEQA